MGISTSSTGHDKELKYRENTNVMSLVNEIKIVCRPDLFCDTANVGDKREQTRAIYPTQSGDFIRFNLNWTNEN